MFLQSGREFIVRCSGNKRQLSILNSPELSGCFPREREQLGVSQRPR